MKNVEEFFRNIYKKFNERDIEGVIEHMTPDVEWANGMQGGYEHGHRGVRNYWTRQFSLVKSTVTPIDLQKVDDNYVLKVRQSVEDLKGIKISNSTVKHVFHLKNGKIARFDIGKK